MSLKIYKDFEEIDRDLQILELEKKIAFEKIKLNIDDVKESLSPLGMISNTLGSIAKKAMIAKIASKFLGK